MAWGRLLLLACFAAPAPARLAGQDEDPLFFSVSEDDGSLRMRVGSLFGDPELTQALHSGLPLRMQIRVELWRDGFFDRQRGEADWRASVLYDPLERRYRIATGAPGSPEVVVDSLARVAERLSDTFEPTLRPVEQGRFYYLGFAEVRTLSLSDLDELERWLQGEVAPSASEDEDREVGNLLGRSFRRVFVRVLGLPSRRFRVETPKFEFDPGG